MKVVDNSITNPTQLESPQSEFVWKSYDQNTRFLAFLLFMYRYIGMMYRYIDFVLDVPVHGRICTDTLTIIDCSREVLKCTDTWGACTDTWGRFGRCTGTSTRCTDTSSSFCDFIKGKVVFRRPGLHNIALIRTKPKTYQIITSLISLLHL